MSLVHQTLVLEQMLTTGGGWQDQVGGLVPGSPAKISRSDAALPLQPEVRPSAWCALLSKHTVTHASERYKEQEHELMASAKQDAVVQKAIAGDVRLWKETVLPLFDKSVGKLKVR